MNRAPHHLNELFTNLKTGLISGSLVLLTCVAQAATFTVTSLSDSGAGSLREAITTANTNGEEDIIEFNVSGMITLASVLPAITTDLTIAGPGAENLTINGDLSSRIFEISGTANAVISHLRIEGGYASGNHGGAIIVLNDALLSVDNCVFHANAADVNGGAVWIVSNNGAIFTACYFVANTSGGNGGAIDVAIAGTGVLVLECLFEGNGTNGANGGAIATAAEINIASSTFADNFAFGNGGAIATELSAPGIVLNCTIVNNSASGNGGGINGNSNLEIGNNILFGNTASGSGPNVIGAANLDYNIVGDASDWFLVEGHQNILGVDPLLGALTYNGGPTKTFLPLVGSLAIDAGDNTSLPLLTLSSELATDQRQLPRIVNGVVDIGAVEVVPPTPTVPASGLWAVLVALATVVLSAFVVLRRS